MKILKLFLLIGSSLLITSCGEDHIDYIDTHKICVVNNTLSTIKIYADTIYLSVLPNDSIESDFDFGDSFFWGYDYTVSALFDCHTLRIIQIKGTMQSDEEKGNPIYYYKNYQIEYDEDGDAPVLNNISFVRKRSHTEKKCTVRRISQ